MHHLRQHLSWMLFIWLAFEGTVLAAPVVLAAAGSMPVEELCTCPGGDHETCPMHHGQESDASDLAVCSMCSVGGPMDMALLSMAGGVGLLPESAGVPLQLRSSMIPASEFRARDLAVPHDTPPPRL
jgi:hypothetical protein